MTHGVRKIKINQRFSRSITIPGNGFYKIDLQGKDTIIKIHYTSAVNPHPFRPTHLVKLEKTHGRIIYGNISLPYSSIFSYFGQNFSIYWPVVLLQNGKQKMLKVKDFSCPVKMRNCWRNYATMILKMRVERVNLRNLGRRSYISQTKKRIKVNDRALLSSKHPSRAVAHDSGMVSLMYQESGTLGTRIPNFTKNLMFQMWDGEKPCWKDEITHTLEQCESQLDQ